MPLDDGAARIADRLPRGCVAQQSVHPARELGHVTNDGQSAGGMQGCYVVSEITGVRTDCDGAAEARWLQRILAATWGNEAATDEHDRRQAIPETELPQRIGDPDALGRRRVTAGAEMARADFLATFGMAGRNDGQQARVGAHQEVVDGNDQLVFAWMGAGCEPERSARQ